MKKEWKQIIIIIAFMIIGLLIGRVTVSAQIAQSNDPETIRFFAENGMEVPEPMSFAQGMTGFALLFSGFPAGVIIFRYFADKWLKSTAPQIFLAILTMPIYVPIGALCSVPMIIYKLIRVFTK